MPRTSRTHRKLLSIVIPVFNEEENLPVLYDQLRSVLTKLPYEMELIFIDDGSTDKTLTIIGTLASKDRRVKALSFSRNFGHQAALVAGLEHASGDAVITMDGDLQHPPALIPDLLRAWEKGAEVVQTIRAETAGEPFFKHATSRAYYRIINAFSDTKVPPFSADFRLLDRRVVATLNRIPERDRFLRGLISWVGFRTILIPYRADARFAGTSKYTIRRMLGLAVDGILSFSAAPLHAVTAMGLIVSFLSFCYGIYSLYAYFFTSQTVPGWTSLLVTVLFLGGVQLVSIGVLGEYLIRVYNETKGRPVYILRESIGLVPLHDARR